MIEQCLQYGDVQIPYQVLFVPGRQCKVAIHVHPNGRVQVDAPPQTSLVEVKQAVSKRSRWLFNHIERIREQRIWVLPREYVSGESHFYLGRRYVLKVRKSKRQQPGVKLRQGLLQVTTDNNNRDSVKTLLWDWYKDHARNQFDRRLEALWQETNWVQEKPTWKLRTMKKQWGSCSPKGILSLNPHLVKAPSQCIDYVLLHELCHLKFHNHSRHFYRLLKTQMPEWEAVKGRLDGMAELLLNS
ncbi:M48 family metallopeptidase [endosymbiont of Lamellibrachia barhami]|uniref:M48 family metallopeptidase n=1 Tax=endosymbiont of Lamellibrachia barhami TaxID=205975 RepID=UPI001C4DBC6E|nr:SprT family zinc-dependent metalloprotease [endosymbiont of Lamellibrachia barhami]